MIRKEPNGHTHRLDPDALLRSVQRTQERHGQGKLRIFLGMAAGVGKTYAMLQAAQRLVQEEGQELVVGYVETHGRAETTAILAGLKVIPRRLVHYRDTVLEEMDLDAILQSRPRLVLVDELAHSNAPESRHPKRYQDVLELLESGIDVYTTLNVQHIESRADSVQQITGVPIQERIPDTILDRANAVILVDLTPEELLERLAEGKVYLGERAQRAKEHFFRKGNLNALREMVLRLTADRVDQDVQDYLHQHRIHEPWRSSQRLMVAVSPSPMSAELIRWTRRMAGSLDCAWMAVYVDTGRSLSDQDKNNLSQNLDLARELGAEVLITQGEKWVPRLLQMLEQQHITQLILGKPQQNRWRDFLNGSFWDFYKLVYTRTRADLWLVDSSRREAKVKARPLNWGQSAFKSKQYGIALGSLVGVTAFNLLLNPILGYWSVALIYLLGVMGLAIFLETGPVLLMAGLSAFSWNFLFIPPLYTLRIDRFQDLLMCGVYFCVALTTAGLMTRIRRQEIHGRQREARLAVLYRFSESLSRAHSYEHLLNVALEHIQQLIPLEIRLLSGTPGSYLERDQLNEREWTAAQWVFQYRRPAGIDTDTLPSAEHLYLPIFTTQACYAVLQIQPNDHFHLGFEQRQLLETLCQQLALALEHFALQAQTTQNQISQISENLYQSLLNSVSHELRTPLTAIQGSVENLRNQAVESQPASRDASLEDLESATQRLNHLVANLLDMSRLQSGKLELHQDWCDPGDILRAAQNTLSRELKLHPLKLVIPAELPPIKADFGILEQTLINLLHNAIRYTPAQTEIEMGVSSQPTVLKIWVKDAGPGIPPEVLPHIFETFYRGQPQKSGGTGLGLSICKGLIEAQGGKISAQNCLPHGAEFEIELPLSKVPNMPPEEDL
jgi:two-component system, OmpR family, sensor histidine kinase KdpD